ncbi:MAG TPA: efflux RND transporter permease subunit [Gemmataceae bacterium]|nr:efflux RND transporter permease subunit [Gemmataceae bacterium]
MNPIAFALRHPITVMVAVLAMAGSSIFAFQRMKIDIFPELNLPVIYVAQPYGGMDPAQMEGLITNYYEYHFLYIAGIHHVESKNVQGTALMKLYFHPGTDMAQAMAETINYVNRSKAFMPVGTVSPFVMRFDTGSVPVGYLVLSTKTPSYTLGELQRRALFDIRPIFASLPGVSAPPPFGGNQRAIVVKVDPNLLEANKVELREVIVAVNSANTISPSGNMVILDQLPIIRVNALTGDPKDKELANTPIRPGSNLCLRDIGTIEDATDVPTGVAVVNGTRTVYLLVTKRADASTLAVVNAVKANMARMQQALPEDIDIRMEFDQSPYVTRAMWGVGAEGLLGAFLTGLMVLLFLRDWRSVVVVVLNIPLALLGALVALWLTGQTLNLMTLGGLALAVGILVDEATVEVENIHTQMDKTHSIATAVRLGNAETAVPRLLAMLCILAVFLPSFFMEGAARSLFVPLSLAVGFSMVTSYFLSSTFVPVLSVWLLRHYHPETTANASRFSFDRLRERFFGWLNQVARLRWAVLACYAGVAVALVLWWVVGHPGTGTEIFPNVESGQLQMRLKAPTGTHFERTEQLTNEAVDIIKQMAGPENVEMSLAYIGIIPSSYPINNVYLWTSGPEEAVLRIGFKRGAGVRTEELKERIRKEMPKKLGEFLAIRLRDDGLSVADIEQRVAGIKLSFGPADIINEVMSFGAPTPIEVAVSGPKLAEDQAHAEKIYRELAKIEALRDLQYVQPLDYPTIDIKVDREKLGLSGGTMKGVTDSVIAATASSRFVVPVFWPDPNTGIGFQIQVEIPQKVLASDKSLGQLILVNDPKGPPLRLQDVASITPNKMPGEYDRYNMRRTISITANIQGEDLGRVSKKITDAVAAAGQPPRGVQVDIRGQVVPMEQIFNALALGLLGAGVVIFLLLTAYFQSPLLALVVMATAPAVLAGVAVALVVTGTSLNIQSFMGAIMAIGVAVANAILLVTFAERSRLAGASPLQAALEAARQRIRPILMTSCAMIAGMMPMALALGEGGEQSAPLGRAVIGGLAAATVTTLIVLPFVFAFIQSIAGRRSVSLDPLDPNSEYHEPQRA